MYLHTNYTAQGHPQSFFNSEERALHHFNWCILDYQDSMYMLWFMFISTRITLSLRTRECQYEIPDKSQKTMWMWQMFHRPLGVRLKEPNRNLRYARNSYPNSVVPFTLWKMITTDNVLERSKDDCVHQLVHRVTTSCSFCPSGQLQLVYRVTQFTFRRSEAVCFVEWPAPVMNGHSSRENNQMASLWISSSESYITGDH